MYENGIKEVEKDTREIETITAKITKIAQGVIDGNSHYYVMLEGSDEIFDVSVVDFIDIIKYEVGQEVTVEYKEGDKTNTVLSFNGEELQNMAPSSDGRNADTGQQDGTAQDEEGAVQE